MTHDGQLLIAAAGPLVYFLDVGNLIANGPQSVLGSISDGPGAGSIDVNVTADDRWLFVADENLNQITVIDLDRARSGGYPQDAIVGAIPTGEAPTHVDFSADGQWLYSTSEVALPRGKNQWLLGPLNQHIALLSCIGVPLGDFIRARRSFLSISTGEMGLERSPS
jgi:hypothetical protein